MKGWTKTQEYSKYSNILVFWWLKLKSITIYYIIYNIKKQPSLEDFIFSCYLLEYAEQNRNIFLAVIKKRLSNMNRERL